MSNQQKAENYTAFNELMNNGVYLPDLLKKIQSLEEKVEAMDRPKENPIDAELFGVMEQAVKEDPAVADARRRLQVAKTRVISELCIKDEEYRKLFDEYRRKVNAAYVQSREEIKGSDRGCSIEICQDTTGSI